MNDFNNSHIYFQCPLAQEMNRRKVPWLMHAVFWKHYMVSFWYCLEMARLFSYLKMSLDFLAFSRFVILYYPKHLSVLCGNLITLQLPRFFFGFSIYWLDWMSVNKNVKMIHDLVLKMMSTRGGRERLGQWMCQESEIE